MEALRSGLFSWHYRFFLGAAATEYSPDQRIPEFDGALGTELLAAVATDAGFIVVRGRFLFILFEPVDRFGYGGAHGYTYTAHHTLFSDYNGTWNEAVTQKTHYATITVR
jgi:hypothetical protein